MGAPLAASENLGQKMAWSDIVADSKVTALWCILYVNGIKNYGCTIGCI